MKRRSLQNSLLCMCLVAFWVHAEEGDVPIEQVKEGNLALPGSQQPGPLFGFGQNMVGKNGLQGFLIASFLKGKGQFYTIMTPSFLYGVSENLSLFLFIPLTTSKFHSFRSAGLGDISLQAEYAYHTKTTRTYTNQLTAFFAVGSPTGSALKNPPTGNGAFSFVLGATANHLSVEWYVYTSYEAILPLKQKGTQFGNTFFYQYGVGRNICNPPGIIFLGLLEIFGMYMQKDLFKGVVNNNSGGNAIFVAPSLWLSTEKFIVQAGIGIPIAQHLFGIQPKYNYWISTNLTWTFN